MSGTVESPQRSLNCRIADIRELDGEQLLQSNQIGDNIIAILARLQDHRAAVRQVLNRIASGDASERVVALQEFTLLAGLRQLEAVIEQEANQMPLLDDIMDNKVLGREFRRGLDLGREQGREQGRHDGELSVLLRLMQKRFGLVPAILRERLEQMPAEELESAALRVLDAGSLDEFLN